MAQPVKRWRIINKKIGIRGQMYSQIGQDEWVLSRIAHPGYFVDIGATDGITNNNTYALENRGWSGICVEPNLDCYAELKNNRNCIISTAAIYPIGGKDLELIVAGEYSTLHEYADSDHHYNRRQHRTSQRVVTMTLDELLKLHNAPQKIDYLSLDTEGSELDILMNYSWGYEIRLITVEHNYGKNKEPLAQLLEAKGYIQSPEDSQWDFWYEKGY
jgi:FkbM family methyltransferase